MDPALLSVALGDGCDAAVSLDFSSALESVSVLAKCGEQSRGIDRRCAREAAEDFEVREARGHLLDFLVVGLDGRAQGLELRDEGLDRQLRGRDDAGILGERPGRFDALNSRFDAVSSAHVMVMKEARQRRLARSLCLLDYRPASDEVAEDHGALVLKPVQNLRIVLRSAFRLLLRPQTRVSRRQGCKYSSRCLHLYIRRTPGVETHRMHELSQRVDPATAAELSQVSPALLEPLGKAVHVLRRQEQFSLLRAYSYYGRNKRWLRQWRSFQ